MIPQRVKRKLRELHPFSKQCVICGDLTTYKYTYQILKGELTTVSYSEDSLINPFVLLTVLARQHRSIYTYPLCQECLHDMVAGNLVTDDVLDQVIE